MKKTILSMLFLLAGIGCFAQKSGIIIGVTDGHLGKYSGYSYYLSTGTANGTIYPETRWTPGIGVNFGYQFGFKLSNRFWMDASILGKVVQGKAESFDLNGNDVVPWSDKSWIWGLALNGAINYRICSGLHCRSWQIFSHRPLSAHPWPWFVFHQSEPPFTTTQKSVPEPR